MAITLGKSYSNVFDMLREEFPDQPELAEGAMAEYHRGRIANCLFMLRASHDVTQEELARRMGVSQSKIAKMESKGDSIRISDMIKYVNALNFGVLVQVTDKFDTLADVLRHHLRMVTAIMDEFIGMAKGDPEISEGIYRDFSEEAGKMLSEVLPKCEAMLAKARSGSKSLPPGESGLLFELRTKGEGALVG